MLTKKINNDEIIIPRSWFTKKENRFSTHGRNTSFSIIKHTTYMRHSMALDVATRLEKLKNDKFSGRIKIPYFEFELKENTVITQSEYIKGRPPVDKELPHIYEHVACRPHSWSIIDCNTSNFVVDDFHYRNEISSAIYIVDLDSYKECSVEERKKFFTEDASLNSSPSLQKAWSLNNI